MTGSEDGMGVEAGVGGQREYLIDMEQEMCMGHRQRERERERERTGTRKLYFTRIVV